MAWELSNSLDSEFCIRAWTSALASGRTPLISNTDQGSQFTSEAYLEAVESAGVDASMDGRGRWIVNRFIERLWRSVKQEDIYLQDYAVSVDKEKQQHWIVRGPKFTAEWWPSTAKLVLHQEYTKGVRTHDWLQLCGILEAVQRTGKWQSLTFGEDS